MNGARPAVQDRRFPGEPIEVSWRALCALEPGLNHCALTDLRGHGQGEDVKGLRVRMCGAEYLNDVLRIVSIHIAQSLLHLRFGHRFVFRVIEGGGEFVERGTD